MRRAGLTFLGLAILLVANRFGYADDFRRAALRLLHRGRLPARSTRFAGNSHRVSAISSANLSLLKTGLVPAPRSEQRTAPKRHPTATRS